MVSEKHAQVNVPSAWDSENNKVATKTEKDVFAKQADNFTDILELYENDESKAVEAVNNLLMNQAKQRAYQNALARIKPPDNPFAAIERAVTQLIRCGLTEERAREIVNEGETIS